VHQLGNAGARELFNDSINGVVNYNVDCASKVIIVAKQRAILEADSCVHYQ
jgi:hypothetical protein